MSMWRRKRDEPRDPALDYAAQRVDELTERADRVHGVLRPRMERNHWSETVYEAWTGRAPT